ncbi:DUF2789 family protein [Ferrimonas sp.]|uniref:DUF2789 family protein n=1 Tax=Ferrimonas sp. TaxID=2080861 RepID=UPI003A917EAC
MDTTKANLNSLFDQLGMASDPVSVSHFIQGYHLDANTPIEAAGFWTQAQADFLKEGRSSDGEWSEVIDQLDTLLHKN